MPFAEPLHIEPGLWDVTYSYSLQGQPPPSVLAKLTPEKRADMEKKWAERKGADEDEHVKDVRHRGGTRKRHRVRE